jgi:hypothetical protein
VKKKGNISLCALFDQCFNYAAAWQLPQLINICQYTMEYMSTFPVAFIHVRQTVTKIKIHPFKRHNPVRPTKRTHHMFKTWLYHQKIFYHGKITRSSVLERISIIDLARNVSYYATIARRNTRCLVTARWDTLIFLLLLWHVDPVLDNDWKISKYTAASQTSMFPRQHLDTTITVQCFLCRPCWDITSWAVI